MYVPSGSFLVFSTFEQCTLLPPRDENLQLIFLLCAHILYAYKHPSPLKSLENDQNHDEQNFTFR